MLEFVIPMAFAALTLAMLFSFYRLLRGPDLIDRIVAIDTLYVNALALLVVLGIYYDTSINFEIALAIALMGFLGTAALAKYLLHGDIIQ
jgi:multicomponent K+:H+ antiporter subunit F